MRMVYRNPQPTRISQASGLTLIEVLVSIAIISTLISLFIVSVAGARETARSAVCLSNLRQLALIGAQYILENERVPLVEQRLSISRRAYAQSAVLLGVAEPVSAPDVLICPSDSWSARLPSGRRDEASYWFLPIRLMVVFGETEWYAPTSDHELEEPSIVRSNLESTPASLATALWSDALTFHLRVLDRVPTDSSFEGPRGINASWLDGSARRLK